MTKETSNNTFIVHELKKIGLTDKESQAYLALLGKGPTSAQKMSLTLRLTRPTTYRLLEGLEDKGLVSRESVENKKIKRFVAKAPDELLSLLRIKKRQVEEQERELLRIISELRNTYYEDDGSVQTYMNKPESVEIIMDDIITSRVDDIYIWCDREETLEAATCEAIASQIRARRGNVPVHTVNEKDVYADKPFDFDGTIIVTHKIYIFTEKEISIITNEPMRAFMIAFLKSAS